jgi:hypothetical protein
LKKSTKKLLLGCRRLVRDSRARAFASFFKKKRFLLILRRAAIGNVLNLSLAQRILDALVLAAEIAKRIIPTRRGTNLIGRVDRLLVGNIGAAGNHHDLVVRRRGGSGQGE